MIEVKSMVRRINRRIRSDKHLLSTSMVFCRRDGVGPRETENVEFMEELMEEEYDPYLIEADVDLPYRCWIEGGCLMLRVDDVWAIPLEDIENCWVRIDHGTTYGFKLTEGAIMITFMPDRYIKYWQDQLKKWPTFG
jgi:hypothetical protein